MAQRIRQLFIDDVSGEEIEDGTGETIRYTWQGTDYEIDLDDVNAEAFHETMTEWIEHSRRVGGRVQKRERGKRTKEAAPVSEKEQNRIVREWANEQGFSVSQRGRISADIYAAYEAAQMSRAG